MRTKSKRKQTSPSIKNNPENIESFTNELKSLKKQILKNLSKKDFAHLKKLESWGKACTALGYSTAWISPNLFSAFCMSLGSFTRWTMMTHHICHRGYDLVPDVPKKYTSQVFAKGKRRLLDWFDWILPEAWDHEHNVLHHYHTGEVYDPDLVENNTHMIRQAPVPNIFKYAMILFFMCTWKFSYYAPNTLWDLQKKRKERADNKLNKTKNVHSYMHAVPPGMFPGALLVFPASKNSLELWLRCYLPYGGIRFGFIPLMFLPLGPIACFNVFANSVLAELITNIHSFIVIVTNHAGDDLYRFDHPVKDKDEYYLRQILGSTNFNCGNDLVDFLHGFLNYQIEHHIWPDLPMSQYQKVQPKVKALCKKYNIP